MLFWIIRRLRKMLRREEKGKICYRQRWKQRRSQNSLLKIYWIKTERKIDSQSPETHENPNQKRQNAMTAFRWLFLRFFGFIKHIQKQNESWEPPKALQIIRLAKKALRKEKKPKFELGSAKSSRTPLEIAVKTHNLIPAVLKTAKNPKFPSKSTGK